MSDWEDAPMETSGNNAASSSEAPKEASTEASTEDNDQGYRRRHQNVDGVQNDGDNSRGARGGPAVAVVKAAVPGVAMILRPKAMMLSLIGMR